MSGLVDCKDGLLYADPRTPTGSPRAAKPSRLRKVVSLFLCAALAYSVFVHHDTFCVSPLRRDSSRFCSSRAHRNAGHSVGDPWEEIWDMITPGTIHNLTWTPCFYSDYSLCAKLMVPLDYAHPEGEVATIAVVKIPADVPPSDARYKGPILFNPGGPANSGVSFIGELGERYQDRIGPEFDIIGFDPRGVARTQPQVLAFPDEAEGASWYLKTLNTPLWNTTPDALPRMYASSKVLNSIVDARIGHTVAHVGTTLVARDMLSIVQALGREKLQYWGISYGTVLGATFAAMFPDKVERMVIDGVIDADDYYSATWKKALLATDEALHAFLQACVRAGTARCAVHEPTPEKVHARLTKILETLKSRPVAALGGRGGPLPNYGIVDYKSVKTLLFMFLYYPYTSNIAQRLASALRAVEDGDGGPLWDLVQGLQPEFDCNCAPNETSIKTREAQLAIVCTDGMPRDDTIEDLDRFFRESSEQSEFADVLLPRVACAGWKTRPVERFAGPFVGNTSHPILLIGNTLDPVTPLVNAHTMSKGFSGSVVLTQDSGGHTSLAAPTPCTFDVVRNYFREGVLPAGGTVCTFKNDVFGNPRKDFHAESADSAQLDVDAWVGPGSMVPPAWRGILL